MDRESKSRWHGLAMETIEELLEQELGHGTPAARRRLLMAARPEMFSSGYPAQVWEYEADRATVGLNVPEALPLKGEWPMTAKQKAFFKER